MPSSKALSMLLHQSYAYEITSFGLFMKGLFYFYTLTRHKTGDAHNKNTEFFPLFSG